jgi:hypothetical protein
MGCEPLVNERGEVIGNINRPGAMVHEPIRKRHRWKWCFNCRKRLPHMLTMSREVEPSYYDPYVWWKCGGCGKDFTLFPGQFYE